MSGYASDILPICTQFDAYFLLFLKVYGLKFTQCAEKKENSVQERMSQSSDFQLKKQVSDKDKLLSDLRNDSDVQQAMRYDIAIYRKAFEIFLGQRRVMTRFKT